jgi:hypothetical protein
MKFVGISKDKNLGHDDAMAAYNSKLTSALSLSNNPQPRSEVNEKDNLASTVQ